jgi:hypothetical protein
METAPLMNRLAILACAFLLAGSVAASADDDYWKKNNCSRGAPEAVLVKKGVKGHTFRIAKRRGEALETATVAGQKITIIHFGCDGVGWQFRTRMAEDSKAITPIGVYDSAQKLLKALEPSVGEQARLPEVINAIDSYTSPTHGNPALSERLVAVPGPVPTSVSVSAAPEGADTWLTVMVFTGPQ